MPSCWFLLTKQYLRVDGALTRCREVRLFHRFHPSPPSTATETEADSVPAAGEQEQRPVQAEGKVSEVSEVSVHLEVCWRELAVAPSPSPAQSYSPGPTLATASPATRGPLDLSTRLPPAASTASVWRAPSTTGPVSQEALLMSAQGRNMTHLLPLVNDREGICQYFTLFAQSS